MQKKPLLQLSFSIASHLTNEERTAMSEERKKERKKDIKVSNFFFQVKFIVQYSLVLEHLLRIDIFETLIMFKLVQKTYAIG